MSKIQWDKDGERFFERGVNHGVIYVKDNGAYGNGVAWNGLINVTESPEGAEATPFYADNIKYANILSNEDFKASVEAYTYPDEFKPCIGEASPIKGMIITQQNRKPFGFVYETLIGNDENSELGKNIHIVYNATASVAERSHDTVNDTPELMTLSWDLDTTPVEIAGYKPTAHLVFKSTDLTAEQLEALEAKLFGTATTEPTLPSPDEIIALLGGATPTKVDTPSVAVNDTDAELTITVEADSHAESFDIYEGATFIKNITKSAASTTVTYASLGYTAAGTHNLKVKAQGSGYTDSDFSEVVVITVTE